MSNIIRNTLFVGILATSMIAVADTATGPGPCTIDKNGKRTPCAGPKSPFPPPEERKDINDAEKVDVKDAKKVDSKIAPKGKDIKDAEKVDVKDAKKVDSKIAPKGSVKARANR